MNCRAGPAEPGSGRHGLPKEIEMNSAYEPKSLPWLARRAGVADHVAGMLWSKALTLAGAGNLQVAEPRTQAEAMRYLLLMLGFGAGESTGAAGNLPPAYDAVCQ
jgi:hypothetical protein